VKALLHFAASSQLRAKLSEIVEPRVVVVAEDDEGPSTAKSSIPRSCCMS